MATNDEPQQAMTSERLAEIQARVENLAEVREVGPRTFSDLEPGQLCAIAMAYHEDVPALLAEVERLRAALAQEQQVSMARASALASLSEAYEELAASGDFDSASDEIRARVRDTLHHASPAVPKQGEA